MTIAKGWPSPGATSRFADIAADEIKGPARLYRVLSPSSLASSDCWVSEAVFKKLQSAPDPKAAWRKHLAVWPDWNVNGQFVTYDIKAGESLKVWRGKASTQIHEKMPDTSLEGGWEQIVFDAGTKATKRDVADSMVYYKVDRATGKMTPSKMTYSEYSALSPSKKADYEAVREKINNPSISGPFETKWGYTDFDPQNTIAKLGLPSLPGQMTHLAR